MFKLGRSLRPSKEYADRLRRQLEECSTNGISCEFCANEARCRELYDMVPLFISENDYQRYSKGFNGLRKTKKEINNTNLSIYLSQEGNYESNEETL